MAAISRAALRNTTRSVSIPKLAGWLLILAFVISAAYQLYRSTIMALPAYDAFSLSSVLVYSCALAISWLATTGRCWAIWLAFVTSVLWMLIGILFYFPTITALRVFGPIDWAEGVLYLALIFAAGVLLALDLLGVSLMPSEK